MATFKQLILLYVVNDGGELLYSNSLGSSNSLLKITLSNFHDIILSDNLLTNLPKLKHVDLSNNHELESLPYGLFTECTQLIRIELSNNCNLKSLQDSLFAGCILLRSVYLVSNNFEELRYELKGVDLSRNTSIWWLSYW